MENQTRPGFLRNMSIRSTIYIYFTVSALAAILLIGISLYGRLSGQMMAAIREENQAMLTQVNRSRGFLSADHYEAVGFPVLRGD